MRIWLAALVLLAAPAWAQVDGKAVAAGAAGAKIEAAVGAGGLSRSGMRELVQAMVADGVDAPERDLLTEVASGEALTLTLDGGRSIAFPKPADDVAMIARLVTATPNLNTLWCQPKPAGDQFYELARLSPAAQQRLYTYIGNVLDNAWKASSLLSQFAEYKRELNCGWLMIQSLPEDKEARGLAYDLLIAGVATGIEKAKGEGREPPHEFLYAWMLGDDRRQGLAEAIQRDGPVEEEPDEDVQ